MYQIPEINVLKIAVEDVITTSGTSETVENTTDED